MAVGIAVLAVLVLGAAVQATALHGAWLTVSLAVEGAGLTWAGFLVGERGWRDAGAAVRWTGLASFAVTACRLMLWETLPGLFHRNSSEMLPFGVTFLVPVAAFYLSALAYRWFGGDAETPAWLVGAANLFTLWYITLELTLVIGDKQAGISAGNRAMLISAAWGLYGMCMALAERRFPQAALRDAVRLVLVAALGYLIMGAMQGNGIWALSAVRYVSYAAVLGSVWVSEYLFRRYHEDQAHNGLVSLLAALAVAFIGSFEVDRRLERVFTLPAGQWPDARTFAWQESTSAFWLMTVWGAYAPVLMAAGVRLRSRSVRLAATAISALALLVFLFGGGWHLATAGTLRLLAFACAAGGAGWVAWQGLSAPEAQRKGEAPAFKGLLLLAATVALAWGGLEVYRLVAG
ncbi:MAG TPA: hypothetical protein VGK74_10535 [Symbiobacteriaceae bacterium]|jgi:hypothetical protein